jgi:hypothetical protein
MAKKDKTARSRKAAGKSKPAAKPANKAANKAAASPDAPKPIAAKPRKPRRTPRQRRADAHDNEMLNVVIGVMVLIAVALGVYYYQLTDHERVSASYPPAAMQKK